MSSSTIDAAIIKDTLLGLQAIENETAEILSKLKVKSNLKKTKSLGFSHREKENASSVKKPKGKGRAIDEAASKKRSLSASLDTGLEKTTSMYADRVTVEVYDDASPDVTPRMDNETKAARMKKIEDQIESLRKTQESEQPFRKMRFEDEKPRVIAKRDTFIPGPTISGDDVKAERERLDKLEESARITRNKYELEKHDRSGFLIQDKAAVKMQSLFRGHVGRQKFKLSKKLKEEFSDVEWVEVRDRQTGDVWYYNKVTAESQWERPDELNDAIGSSSTIKKLPIIQGASSGHSKLTSAEFTKTGYQGGAGKGAATMTKTVDFEHLPTLDVSTAKVNFGTADFNATTKTASYMAVMEKQDKDNEAEKSAKREINDLMGFDKLMPAERMIAPDGTFKPQLRATILDALNETRFDSVSSVLADPRWMESDADLFLAADQRAKKAPTAAPISGIRVDPSRKPMASMLVIHQKKRNQKQLHVDPSEEKLDPQQLTTRDLTVRTGEYPGFEVGAQSGKQVGTYNPQSEMCFGCWSAGFMKTCSMHADQKEGYKLKKSQTLLLCRNWDLGVMRRRYRAEEIQEIFLKTSSSLRYDAKRRAFTTVFELKHPIYRWLTDALSKMNNRLFLMLKIQNWLRTFAEDVRRGNVTPRQKLKSDLIKIKRCKELWWMVQNYFKKIVDKLPIAPITGYSWPERIGEIQYLFKHPDPALGMDVELILVDPIPVPKFLYQPREYHVSVPRAIPMPRPSYSEEHSAHIHPTCKFIPEQHPGAWFERLCSSLARDTQANGLEQVTNLTPLPGLELLRRSKQPLPCTIKFATLARKATPGNKDVGSLPMELLMYQLISTYFPPQYGNFMVMDKSTVSPGVTPEMMISFLSVLTPPDKQLYTDRPIEHPLNYRRAPTISVNSYLKPEDRHFYGLNRPNQTGEQDPHGFRTSAWTLHLLITAFTDPRAFIPNADVVSLNNPSANRANTTHADLTYPFCNPSSRDNSTLDFYHLLLCGSISKPYAQVCTALTIQEAGSFFKDCRDDMPMGRLAVSVYRSWAFTQKDKIQEFKTDDGIPYWYHRETGQTFWERPLHDEEEISILKGGVMLDDSHDEMPTTMARGDDLGTLPRHSQGSFRKIMLNHHESDNEAIHRREKAASMAKVARSNGVLPNCPPGYTEAYDGSLIPIPPSVPEDDNAGVMAKPLTFVLPPGSPGDTQPAANFNQPAANISDAAGGAANEHHGHHHGHHHSHGHGHGHGHHGHHHGNHHGHHHGHGQDQAAPAPGSGSLQLGFPDEKSITTNELNQAVNQYNQPTMPSIGAAAGSLGIGNNVLEGLQATLGQMMNAMMADNISPQEMIQLGMGMGMALLSSGAVQGVVQNKIDPPPVQGSYHSQNYLPEMTQSTVTNLLPVVESQVEDVQQPSSFTAHSSLAQKHPIGEPKPTVLNSSTRPLDKNEAIIQKEMTATGLTAPYTAKDTARNLTLVGKASLTPDEAPKKVLTLEVPQDAEERVKKTTPCLVYPELSGINAERGRPDEASLHPSAGVGTSYLTKDLAVGADFVPGSDGALRRLVMPLPIGFFESITSKKVAKQEVEYLPKVPNLPQSRTVGRVKPRSAAVDWLAVAFDPWSAGKNPLSTEFCSLLSSTAEKFLDKDPNKAHDQFDKLKSATVSDAYVTIDDTEGMAKQRSEISKAQIIAEEFKRLCSLCRHGKFVEVEQTLNRTDWNVPIDHQDLRGNTLLHIVCQNGNRRLVKLCLRRGAALNIQNLNGQTPLHFAFGFGFTEVGEYLASKGADDTIRNRDGLTCYEGLGASELANL